MINLICSNCGELIEKSEIAKEVKQSALEEVICQDCWDINEID